MADFENDQSSFAERPTKRDTVSKKALEELGEGPNAKATITIYSRDKNKITHVVDPKFPQDAAALFSRSISDAVRRGDRFYCIDDEDTTAYKVIFDWIRQCREARSDRQIPEITVQDENDPFTPYISVLLAAHKLRIPTGTLQTPLIKKLLPLSRKAIIPLDLVREIFDGFSPLSELGLQDIAATSIYEAWYALKLEAKCYDDYMYDLSDMRIDILDLDKILHEVAERKEAWWNERKDKRKLEREEAQREEAGRTVSTADYGTSDYGATNWDGNGAAGTEYADADANDWATAGQGSAANDWATAGQTGGELLDSTNHWSTAVQATYKAALLGQLPKRVDEQEQGKWTGENTNNNHNSWADEVNNNYDDQAPVGSGVW